MPRLAALLVVLAVAACDTSRSHVPVSPTPIDLTPLATQLIGQSTAFGLDLFAETAAGRDDNLMLSPLSASIALTMLLNGADGATYDQIRAVLGYDADQDLDAVNRAYQSLRNQLLAADPSVRLAIANAAFADAGFVAGQPFAPPFRSAMESTFDARIQTLDFHTPSTLDRVNGWAREATAGRVPSVLTEISPDLVLLLLNAVSFDGDWATPFDRAATRDGAFQLADGTTVEVPTLTGTVPGLTVSGDGYQAAELPYGRGNFSMVVMVPDGPLGDFVPRLRDGAWAEVRTTLDAAGGWSDILVHLPRFSFSTDQLLNAPLQALGMTDAFSSAADLSRMHADPRLYVKFVKQTTFVAVDEDGTEAAAVTTAGVGVVSLGPHLFADRPFVFAIRERTTGTLLFLGQVTDPR